MKTPSPPTAICLACAKGRHRKHTCGLQGIRGRPPKNGRRRFKTNNVNTQRSPHHIPAPKRLRSTSKTMSHGSRPLVVPSLGPPTLPPLLPLPPAPPAAATAAMAQAAVAVAVSPTHEINEIDAMLNDVDCPLLVDFGASSGGEGADFTNDYWDLLTNGGEWKPCAYYQLAYYSSLPISPSPCVPVLKLADDRSAMRLAHPHLSSPLYGTWCRC